MRAGACGGEGGLSRAKSDDGRAGRIGVDLGSPRSGVGRPDRIGRPAARPLTGRGPRPHRLGAHQTNPNATTGSVDRRPTRRPHQRGWGPHRDARRPLSLRRRDRARTDAATPATARPTSASQRSRLAVVRRPCARRSRSTTMGAGRTYPLRRDPDPGTRPSDGAGVRRPRGDSPACYADLDGPQDVPAPVNSPGRVIRDSRPGPTHRRAADLRLPAGGSACGMPDQAPRPRIGGLDTGRRCGIANNPRATSHALGSSSI